MWYNHGLCLIQSLHGQGMFLGLRLGLNGAGKSSVHRAPSGLSASCLTLSSPGIGPPATLTRWMKMTLWRTISWHLMWPSVSLGSCLWLPAKRWRLLRSPTSSAWSCTSPSSMSSSGALHWDPWVSREAVASLYIFVFSAPARVWLVLSTLSFKTPSLQLRGQTRVTILEDMQWPPHTPQSSKAL